LAHAYGLVKQYTTHNNSLQKKIYGENLKH